jgi:hypothetical protein
MTNARIFRRENRLASLLRKPGGLTVEEALKRAERHLEAVREKSVSALDGMIEEVAQIAASKDADKLTIVKSHANEIFSLAGTFQLKELSEAANSLHELLIYGPQGEATPWSSIGVHVDALRSLRRPEMNGDLSGRMAVVQGLRLVSARLKRAENGEG